MGAVAPGCDPATWLHIMRAAGPLLAQGRAGATRPAGPACTGRIRPVPADIADAAAAAAAAVREALEGEGEGPF